MIRLLLVLLFTADFAVGRGILLRGFLLDPVQPPTAGFTIRDQADTPIPIVWRVEGWSEPVSLQIKTPELTVHAPDGSMAAKAKLPPDTAELLLILVRKPAADATPPYLAIVLDASPAAFAWGTSQVVNLLGVDAAIHAGEHRLILAAGKTTKIPVVKTRDEFNMAQVDFHRKQGDQWVPFSERRIQFVDDNRRVILVHAPPGSQQPMINTLIDYEPQREPGT
jgi:hypothetical protein